MSVLSAQPNPSYRQNLQSILDVAPGAGEVAGQWAFGYNSGRLFLNIENLASIDRLEVLAFINGASAVGGDRFGTGTIASGQASVTISNQTVSAGSFIFVTPSGLVNTTGNAPIILCVTAKVAATSFTVTAGDFGGGSTVTVDAALNFSYLIIN
jgi:hypothetical protein